jgi:hypothetical protein
MFVSGFIFSYFSGLGREKSLFRAFIFNNLSALDTMSMEGSNVALPFEQFVGLPCHRPSHLPPIRPFSQGITSLEPQLSV